MLLRLKVHDLCALSERKAALPQVHDKELVGPMSLISACKAAVLGCRHRNTAVLDNESAAATKPTTRGNRRVEPVATATLLTAMVASMDCPERRPESPNGALTTVSKKHVREDGAVPQQQLPPRTRRPSSILKNRSNERPTLAAVGRQISFGRNVEITVDLTTTPSAHKQAQEARHDPEPHNRWRGMDLVRSDSMPRLPTRNLDGLDRPPMVRSQSVPSLSQRNVRSSTAKSKRRLESV